MNLGWQRARRMLKEWGILAALMVLLHALLFLAWAALNPGRSTPLPLIAALMLAYVIGLAARVPGGARARRGRHRAGAGHCADRVARETGFLGIVHLAPNSARVSDSTQRDTPGRRRL